MSDAEDDAFRQYFLCIEQEFGMRRGSPLLLSPRDVSLVRDWHEAEIPIEAVLRGLNDFFTNEEKRHQARRGAVSLAFCERDVFLAFEDLKTTRLGSNEGAFQDDAEVLWAPSLLAAAERLRCVEAQTSLQPALKRTLGKTATVLESLAAASDADTSHEQIEKHLLAEDRRIERTLRGCLQEAETTSLRAEAEQELAVYASRLGKQAFREVLKRAEGRRLLERYGLPRLAGLLS